MEEKLQQLISELKKITNLNHASAVLGWDQEVNMPLGGASARAEQIATLQTLAHELFTRDEIGQLLTDLAGAGYDDDSTEASLVRVAQRDYDEAVKLPAELVAEMGRTFSLGQQVWSVARRENAFAQFRDTLAKIIDLNIQAAECYGYEDSIYDPLLNRFEPGMTTAQVARTFDSLKTELVPLVEAISGQTDAVDDAILQQSYPKDEQWAFGLQVLRDIGYDLERGRLDESEHPFTTNFSINDVRITTRVHENLLSSALFSTLHEAGHGMYEQGADQALEGLPLAGGTSLGLHESQSRLWENVLGRSEPFWTHYYPKLQATFPDQLGQVPQDAFYRAINRSQPSLIRTEADEVTYNLHIFLRFELEQALLKQELSVDDLPAAWNAKMDTYLGLTPPDDTRGVLQDIHWSGGMFGYFPTYSLGNLMSVQFYQQALNAQPDLPDQFARGEFGGLLAWFRENIHQHGRKYTANQLIKRTTGGDGIDADPYITYIKQKFGAIYAL